MANLTLSVPEQLHKRMQNYNEIKWSIVVRNTIEKRLDDLEMMDKLAAKVNLSKEDADEIAKLIKADVAKELYNEHNSGC
jgi:hypothetical protein